MNGSPVVAAIVKASVFSKRKTEVVLYDDGKHGDGAANDGAYGAITEKLDSGDHYIEARAETNGQTRTASASTEIGTAGE